MDTQMRYKKWYAKNRAKRLAYLKKYRSKNPELYRASWRKWRDKQPKEARRAYDKIKRQNLKAEVLSHYASGLPRCACCGVEDVVFLSIDHISGNGNKHRKSINIKSGGGRFYAWLKRNHYPKGYQVLCHNCNFAKYYAGVCPHRGTNK